MGVTIEKMITFEEVFTFEHLMECANECCKNVRWKSSTQLFEANKLSNVSMLHKQLMEGTWKSKGFTTFYINERGKTRKIQSVHITERCVQKCYRKYCLDPLILPRILYRNCASIKGKGTDFAIMDFRQSLAHHIRKYGVTGGVLTGDIHNYFGSIPHERLEDMLKALPMDERLYELGAYFIDCFDGEYGVGLGSEVDQSYGIYYLNPVDHYIAEQLHIEGYIRYNDDFIGLCPDVNYLKSCIPIITDKIAELGLEVNTKKTCVTELGREGFTFLKKRFDVSESGKIIMRLSRPNITHRRRRTKRQADILNSDIPTGRKNELAKSMWQSLQSWEGYAKHADAYNAVSNAREQYNHLLFDEWR